MRTVDDRVRPDQAEFEVAKFNSSAVIRRAASLLVNVRQQAALRDQNMLE
jgi:hypothetical protein